MTTTDVQHTVRLSAAEVAALPWQELHGVPEAMSRVLWTAGRSMAGVLRLPANGALERHVHAHGHHHAYVVEGECLLDGQTLPSGSYVHGPAGQSHRIAAGPSGCEMFYLFIED